MTIAYWSVLAAALIPYLLVGYAKFTPAFLGGNYNKNPREYEEGLQGARKRAHWAQLNGYEAFSPFAAGVIIAIQAGVPATAVEPLALGFVACRLLYGIFYIVDLDRLRSLVWFCGIGCVVALFALAGSAGS